MRGMISQQRMKAKLSGTSESKRQSMGGAGSCVDTSLSKISLNEQAKIEDDYSNGLPKLSN